MGFWKNLRTRFGKKDFSSGGWDGRNLELWHPSHPLGRFVTSSTPSEERIENDFESFVQKAFKENGAIFAVEQARILAFSEARFVFRRFNKGRSGDIFTNPSLALLKNPWPGGTTGELLARMEQDAFFAGNFFATTVDDNGRVGKSARGGPGERIVRLRPDWVTILVGTKRKGSRNPNAADARVLAYIYEPRQGGTTFLAGTSPEPEEKLVLMPDEVCHYSPIPDPLSKFRGMSWITPLVREIDADTSATVHKGKFFRNAAVPNIVVKFDRETDEDTFDEFVGKFEEEHTGSWNSYKTLFLMGGADVTPISHDFRQLEFSATVGKGESRIAAAAGVPSTWVGFSEGMQGSSLNAGNYNAQRRRFADGTIRPLWRVAAASLSVLVDVPGNAELWYDEAGIAFLREDEKDRAEIMRIGLEAMNVGIMAGFEPDAVVEAFRDRDPSKLLGRHTGLVSVQMMSPKSMEKEEEAAGVFLQLAQAAQALAFAQFKPESIAEAIDTLDPSKLEKAELPPALPGGAAGPGAGPGAGGAPKPGGAQARPAAAGGGPKPQPKAPPKGAK